MRKLIFSMCASTLLLVAGCDADYYARPKGYPVIHFPAQEYVTFESSSCPLTFDAPSWAKVEQDTLYFDEAPEHPCWLNIVMPQFNATIHMNYKALTSAYTLDLLRMEAHKLTYKHTIQATSIEPEVMPLPNGGQALIYEVGGDAASAYQFYASDMSNHFIRGALYFYEQPNADSLQPVHEFIHRDIRHLLESIRWQ